MSHDALKGNANVECGMWKCGRERSSGDHSLADDVHKTRDKDFHNGPMLYKGLVAFSHTGAESFKCILDGRWQRASEGGGGVLPVGSAAESQLSSTPYCHCLPTAGSAP